MTRYRSSAHRRVRLGAAAFLVTIGALMAVTACAGPAPSPEPSRPSTDAAGLARSFLERTVRDDGRVTRPDQGGDTVSEGQAYGLLLAEVAGDDAAFARIWQWSAQNLQRPDRLLSWHWKDGAVTDPQPASDADLLAAWALTRYQGPDAASFHRAGSEMAAAILEHEVVQGPRGPVLAAGPWATAKSPYVVDPSYWTPQAYLGLSGADPGEKRWAALADAVAPTLAVLTENGRRLPPDWAVVSTAGARPTAAPGAKPGSAPQYGLDAQRVPVWLGASCREDERTLAQGWWSLLRVGVVHRSAVALSVNGDVLHDTPSPLGLVASSTAARASSVLAVPTDLLEQAVSLDQEHRTYYGGAWVALGAALREGKIGGHCAG